MPDWRFRKAEQGLQLLFRKSSIFSYLTLALVFLAIHCWLRSMPNRADLADAQAAVGYVPLQLDPADFAPLRLAGAWRVEVADSRFGGVSALALDGGKLLALTDSGTIIRLPKPGSGGGALVHDLPAGPGTSAFKFNRDAEAIARNPSGGWWVAFENWNQLWRYDETFTRTLGSVDLGRDRWPENRGVEAMVADGNHLTLFNEDGDRWLELAGGKVRTHRLVNGYGFIADAVRAPDGRLFLVARQLAVTGLTKRLLTADADGRKIKLRSTAMLKLGATDNVEGIAAEPLAPRGTRLWLITDNDFRPRKATVLVALDVP